MRMLAERRREGEAASHSHSQPVGVGPHSGAKGGGRASGRKAATTGGNLVNGHGELCCPP
jgi:hypothetical protein